MAKLITVSGSLSVDGDACPVGSASQLVRELSLGRYNCNGAQQYEAVVSSTVTLSSTVDDLDCLDALTAIELLYLKTSASMTLRLDALPASGVGVGASYPTGFTGSETLISTVDGTPVTTTFDVADQTLTQVINRVNAAFALAGFATPRADSLNGQLRVQGVATAIDGSAGTVSFSGTGASTLGMDVATITNAQGKDIPVGGLALLEFPRSPNAPTKIQAFGDAVVDIVAAGRSI
jgi:hypothetical protein